MRLSLALMALLGSASIVHAAPVSLADLAKPPADAQVMTIMSSSGVHGHSALWITPDGQHMGRDSLNLRVQIFEVDSATRLGPDGMIEHLVVRGFTPQGDAAETFDVANGQASWKSPVDAASTAYATPAMYSAFGGPMDVNATFVDALIAAPGHTLTMLPGGEAHAEPLTTLVVGEGPAKQTITAYAVSGIANTPLPVWVDEKGKFFAIDGGLTWIRAGYEAYQPKIDKAQDEAMGARSPAIAHALFKKAVGPVAFTHVRAFVDGNRFVEDQTVVVQQKQERRSARGRAGRAGPRSPGRRSGHRRRRQDPRARPVGLPSTRGR